MYLEIAFPLPLNRTFHYSFKNGTEQHDLPAGRQDPLIGRRVLAPFGKMTKVGYVVGTQVEAPSFATKPINAWIDSQPLLDQNLLDLAEWMAQTCLCSVGEALAAILPPQLQAPKRVQLSSTPSPLPPGEGGPSKTVGEAIRLSSEQSHVLAQFIQAVDAKTYHPFLLRGITNSGKTELYLRTIDHVLKQGRQALFLLPEIALTPPFIDLLRTRYGEANVGIWHSGISAGERYRTWERARSGELQVLLGARSAAFAPFPQLGAVIVDEEHESSYKQEDRPRYHARDVALWRSEKAGATLILGSATPSLESYAAAKKGIYTLVELTSRVEMKELPPVTLIDRRPPGHDEKDKPQEPGKKARRARHGSGFTVFSEPLKLAIEQRLARREQVILFVNRRGYTPFMRCSKCGWVARCDRCSLTLGEHLADPAPYLQCHGCLRRFPMIIQCPACKSMRLGHFGIGTQRVEQEVKHLFPFVKIARMDRDVGSFRRTYEKVYRAFAARELDVLVGTQIIAKGFDFPGVTLVGVVDADVSLHLPDFRAAERTFQLMAQVGGRTGRGDRPGQVLVQTHHPEHYALQAAQQHDYVRFFAEETPHREALNYPPYCRLINLIIRGRREDVTLQSAEELAEDLRTIATKAEVLGPAPAPHSRVRKQYRYQIVLKGDTTALQPAIDALRGKRLAKAFLTVDIDPANLI
jgi:primosomal protein N' (replication factor Y)